jgi:4-carboxymuconolactone decarboxylase
MTRLDPEERTARGRRLQAASTGAPGREPATVLEASWRDYVYAEVWARPGLGFSFPWARRPR